MYFLHLIFRNYIGYSELQNLMQYQFSDGALIFKEVCYLAFDKNIDNPTFLS